MRIIIFGSNGMLGRYVSTYFEEQGHDVIKLVRGDYNLSYLTYDSLEDFLNNVVDIKNDDTIINCAGIINQRENDNLEDYFKVNSYFPKYLDYWKNKHSNNVRIIHASTDCVFSGIEGAPYIENDLSNAIDTYGFSKAMSEYRNLKTIRVSIIGEELNNKVSFLEFVRGADGGTINGFTNQIWNGITCLQWAKSVEIMTKMFIYNTSLIHFFSEPITKYELAKMIRDVYDVDVRIIPIEAKKCCDKSLTSMFSEKYIEQFKIPDLKTQLIEMKEFNLSEKIKI